MKCDEVRAQLPDFVLDSLREMEEAAVRAHLRGCASCRNEATRLDEGMVMFATAAHEVAPPLELRDRVLGVLAEEWAEEPTATRPPFVRRRLLPAAAAVVLTGVVAWGTVAQVTSNRNAHDAEAYRSFLATLGGTDVRVGSLTEVANSGLTGSVILYDSDREQSWGLVLVRAPGLHGDLIATLVGARGHTIELFPITLEEDGDGSTWLVTSSDISRFDRVRITTTDGTLVAQASVSDEA